MEKNKKQEPKKLDSCSCGSGCHCGSKLIPMLLVIIAASIIFIIGACFGARIGNETRYRFNKENFKSSDHYGCPFRQNNLGNNDIPTSTPTTTPENPIK